MLSLLFSCFISKNSLETDVIGEIFMLDSPTSHFSLTTLTTRKSTNSPKYSDTIVYLRRRLMSSLTRLQCFLSPLKRTRIKYIRTSSSLNYDRNTGIITSKEKTPLTRTLIGLEIHAQLTNTNRKLFSPSNTNFDNTNPNTKICHFDIAYPGALPLLSKKAIYEAILTASALNCKINEVSRFERKHYIYPDLPHGYQITQQRWPFASDGMLVVNDDVCLPLDRIQLEMDSGKTIVGEDGLLLDYNRAGFPVCIFILF